MSVFDESPFFHEYLGFGDHVNVSDVALRRALPVTTITCTADITSKAGGLGKGVHCCVNLTSNLSRVQGQNTEPET